MRSAVVVGGGPAGASAAMALVRGGFAVRLLEQRAGWQGRVCGGFINPEGVSHLAWLGALDDLVCAGAVPVQRTRLTQGSGREGVVRIGRGGRTGLAVSRRTLEAVLLERARAAGCAVMTGVRAGDVAREGGRFLVTARAGSTEQAWNADLVVLADGRFTLASSRGSLASGMTSASRWFGWNATFAGVRQAPGELSMHFYRNGYVGVLTFADGTSNVCGLVRDAPVGMGRWDHAWSDALDRQPALRDLAASARRLDAWRGVGPLPFSRRMRQSPGLLAAGDAAAVGDPYMGEGISRALGTGPLLHAALGAGGGWDVERVASDYAARWRKRYDPRLRLGSFVRGALDRPALFDLALGLLLRTPRTVHALTRVFHPLG